MVKGPVAERSNYGSESFGRWDGGKYTVYSIQGGRAGRGTAALGTWFHSRDGPLEGCCCDVCVW